MADASVSPPGEQDGTVAARPGAQTRHLVREGTSPAQIDPVAVPGVRELLNLVVAVVVVAALYLAKDVLLPMTLAVLLSFVLSPAVNALTHVRLPRAAAVLLTVAAALGLIGVLGTVVFGQAASLAEDAPRYARTIEVKVNSVSSYVAERTKAVTGSLSVAPRSSGARKAAEERARATDAEARLRRTGSAAAPIPVQVQEAEPTSFDVARQLLAPIVGPLETFVIVITIAIFILVSREDLRDRLIRVFGSADLHRTTTAMDDAAERLSRYFLSQLAVNTSFGLVVWLGLFFIGIPSAALWGVLAGLLRFIPYIGAILAVVAPLALAAAIDPGWTLLIYVVILFAIVEVVTGYVVEPLLYGHQTGLSPISVLVAAVFWTWLWGPIGLIISTPLTLCFVVLGRHVKSLEFLDVLLGDRPPLTPVEMLYQRLLAHNTEEALDQAEAFLVDGQLVTYYDEVAREGLKLARGDVLRGAMTRDKGRELTDTMLTVIGDLEELDAPTGPERPTAPPTGAAAVLCIAGRSLFDAPVAAMTAQLLRRQGVTADTIDFAQVARGAIDPAIVGTARVLCVTYLDLEGAPAHARSLVRRLRTAAPAARIIVGCCRDVSVEGETDGGAGATPFADEQVQSLPALVEACRQNATNAG